MGNFILLVAIGLAAGWLADLLVIGPFGVKGDMVLGLIGSVLIAYFLSLLNLAISDDVLGLVITGSTAAIALLVFVRLAKP